MQRLILALLTAALLLVLGWCFAVERGSAGQFSPQALQVRTRTEFTLFLGSVPLYRSRWQVEPPQPLFLFLESEGYVLSIPGKTEWTSTFHRHDAWKDGSGDWDRLLRRSNELIDWSRDDPERARYVWRRLFELARSPNASDRDIASAMTRMVGRELTASEFEEDVQSWQLDCH